MGFFKKLRWRAECSQRKLLWIKAISRLRLQHHTYHTTLSRWQFPRVKNTLIERSMDLFSFADAHHVFSLIFCFRALHNTMKINNAHRQRKKLYSLRRRRNERKNFQSKCFARPRVIIWRCIFNFPSQYPDTRFSVVLMRLYGKIFASVSIPHRVFEDTNEKCSCGNGKQIRIMFVVKFWLNC